MLVYDCTTVRAGPALDPAQGESVYHSRVWVRAEDNLPRRIETGVVGGQARTRLDYADYGKPITIRAPIP